MAPWQLLWTQPNRQFGVQLSALLRYSLKCEYYSFQMPGFLLFCLLLSHAADNNRPNPSIHKERMRFLRTPGFTLVCGRGSTFSILTAGWYKPRLLQHSSFGRTCCVSEINGDVWKSLQNPPPPLSPSQTLRRCSGSTVWLKWMKTWGVGRMSGKLFPAALSHCGFSHHV